MTNLRRLTTLIASLALATSLSACSDSSDGAEAPGTATAAPSASEAAAPAYTKHNIKAVRAVSGDTLEATITADVDSHNKKVGRDPADYETITFRVEGLDAPAEGECGFAESRDALEDAAVGLPTADAVLDDDGSVMTDEDGLPVYAMSGYWSDVVKEGYARAWTVTGREADGNALDLTEYTQAVDLEQSAQRNGDGLWATCWAK